MSREADERHVAIPRRQRGEQLEQHPRRRDVDGGHARKIQHEVRHGRRLGDQPADRDLHAGKAQIALELIGDDSVAVRGQHLALGVAALAFGREVPRGEPRAHRGDREARCAEEMQLEVLRQRLAHGDAAHAVPALVERRREHADRELPGHHREDPAGHAALGRQPDAVHPLAGIVVHPAGRHDGEDLVDVLDPDHAIARHRVDAAGRERRADHAEVAAVDLDRALAEVEVEIRLRIVLDDLEIAQHVADRAVAVPRVALGPVDRLGELEPPAGVHREQREDARPPVFERVAPHERRRRDRARVDHRIARAAGLDSRLISLNASPVGSTPIRSRTAALPQSSSARP